MFRNYFKTAWRNLIKNKVYSALNVFGLATGMAVALLIGLWVHYQISYDRFLPGYGNVYKARVKFTVNGEMKVGQATAYPLAAAIKFLNQAVRYKTIQIVSHKILHLRFVLLIAAGSLYAAKRADTIPADSQNKHANILFDEAHHNYHKSDGRYKPFADLLRQDGYSITPNKQKITEHVLEGYDVFVCSNAFSSEPDSSGRLSPLLAFGADECHHLKQWVLNGGSMWLIADHDPAGNAVKNLADSFGVDMSRAYTADPEYFDKIVFDASWIRFSVDNKNLGNHPIIKGRNETERIKSVLSFTGQSLKAPGSTPLLLLSDKAYDVLNVEDPLKAEINPAKGRCQALAMEFGKGRVVVCGEAAMFTSQEGGAGANYPGTDNKQLLLNIAHWLTRLM